MASDNNDNKSINPTMICAIIPVFNEEEFIGGLIDSIKENTYKNVEIIVVDDNSTDNTVEIARQKGVKVLVNSLPRKGPAYGWNRAAKESKAEIVFILGAETFFEGRDFFEKAAGRFADQKVVAAKVKFHTLQCNLLEKALTKEWGISFEPRFIRRNFFLELGGFPEIGFGEDRIFARKAEEEAKKRGLKIEEITDTFFSGHGVHNLREMVSQAKWYGKSGVLFLNQFKGIEKIAEFHSVYSRTIYFFSFILGFLGILNPLLYFFWIYFLLFSLKMILSSFLERNFFLLLKIPLFILYGAAMSFGLFIYISGISRNAGK